MLDIICGQMFCPDRTELVFDNRIWFRREINPKSMNCDFVKRAAKEIDLAEHAKDDIFIDRFGKACPAENLSTGFKSLCCLYFSDGSERFNGSMMGNNCVPFLLEIAKEKDVKIYLEHFMIINDFTNITIDGESGSKELYRDYYAAWSGWMIHKGEEWYDKAADGIYELPVLPKENGEYYVSNETDWSKFPPKKYEKLRVGDL